MTFYNTTQETGHQLHQSRIKAASLQDQILNYFRRNPTRHYTPAEVHQHFTRYPLTSVRRAMTDLTTEGALVKTEMLTPGLYGKNNFNWRLAEPRPIPLEQKKLFN